MTTGLNSAATTPVHLEFLVEELSAEVALRVILPKMVPSISFEVRVFSGKTALLRHLPGRLKGYSSWIDGAGVRVIVLIDRDDDDCVELKRELTEIAEDSGLVVASCLQNTEGQVLNRIAVEELESWFLGDPLAIATCYPRVPVSFASRARFRDPDDIRGGTWEALEHLLQSNNYHLGGLSKITASRDISEHMSVEKNNSLSFEKFRDGVRHIVGQVSD